MVAVRTLSSSTKDGKAKTNKKTTEGGGDEEPGSDLVLTPGEKVVVATRLTMWAGIACFAAVCAYYIGKELFPTYVSYNDKENQPAPVWLNDNFVLPFNLLFVYIS